MYILLLFLSSCLTGSTLAAFDTSGADSNYTGYLLSKSTIPVAYDILLNVSREALNGNSTTYRGRVGITFVVTEAKNTIVLHSLVNILNISLFIKLNNQVSLNIANYSVDNTTETVTVLLVNNLNININHSLIIDYEGTLDPVIMQGFYRSEYMVDGKKEYLGTTQMEATHARRVFPSFDEPQYKAIFNLTLVHPEEFTAVSNTPIEITHSNNDTTTTTRFKITPTMSTYLLAFIVSKFTCVTNSSDVAVPQRVCARPTFSNNLNVALKYGKEILSALDTYTGYNYSQMGLDKLDQFAIPDFSAGAMENWGLVTYREYLLTWNETYTSNLYKQRMISVIAHEFAHMWFGNLITTKWWNTTFLNEGFARYFQYYIFDKLTDMKDYEMSKQFIIEQQQTAFKDDSMLNSQSLTSNAWTPSQINEKFGVISYNKGASVLRMVENLIGSTAFQEALQTYISNNAYNVSTPDILWSSIESKTDTNKLPSNISFTEFISNWTHEAGFPLIHASAVNNSIVLTQNRFLYMGNSSTQWFVPISYYTSNINDTMQNITTTWLKPFTNITLENVLTNNSFIIINHMSQGYYRVHYDQTLLTKLKKILLQNYSQIADVNRAQILDDAFNLAIAHKMKYSEVFDLLSYLKNETCYYPWFVVNREMQFLIIRLGSTSQLGQKVTTMLRDHIENISANITKTNWTDHTQVTTIKLQMLFNTACSVGQDQCITESKRLFREFRVNGTSINSNIRNVVYCYAINHSDDIETDWTFLWNRLETVDQPHETLNILIGLGCSTNKTYLLKYLHQSINSSSVIRAQDLATVWAAVYTRGGVGLEAAFEHFTQNHKDILSYYSKNSALLSNMAEYFSTENDLKKLEDFAKTLEGNSTLGLLAEKATAKVRANLDWQSSITNDVAEYFSVPTSTVATSTVATSTVATSTIAPIDGGASVLSLGASLVLLILTVILAA